MHPPHRQSGAGLARAAVGWGDHAATVAMALSLAQEGAGD